MEESDPNFVRRFFIHRAVSWGGWLAWDENEDIREAGKTREIPEEMLPQDPTTTWEKLQKSIFEKGNHPDRRPAQEPPREYCTG
jgi:hypothetical protein